MTVSILAVALTFGSSLSSATPLEARQDALKPFEITAMTYNSPNGRPGNYPWTIIRAEVTDPNGYTFTEGSTTATVPAGIKGINCEAKWYSGEFIEGRTWPCDRAEKGHWAVRVYAGSDPSGQFYGSDFKLKFIHVVEPGPMISSFRAKIEGEGLFKGGPNGTTSFSCAASGGCGASLKAEAKPLLVPVTRTL